MKGAVLKTLHDDLDRTVLDAYGWGDLGELMEVVNGNKAFPHPNPPPGGEGDVKGPLPGERGLL